MGALYLTNNPATTPNSKHIDIRVTLSANEWFRIEHRLSNTLMFLPSRSPKQRLLSTVHL